MWPNAGIAGALLAALLISHGMADEVVTTEVHAEETSEAAKEAAKPSDPDKLSLIHI